MPDAAKPAISPVRNALSIMLFVLAAVLLIVAGYLFWEDRNSQNNPAPPPSNPGQAELKTVYDVLVGADLNVEYGRESARVEDFEPVGQQLIVEDLPLFVFIFSDPEARQDAMNDVDADELELVDSFGDPVTSEPLAVAEGSNVVTIISGADDALASTVAGAVATIP